MDSGYCLAGSNGGRVKPEVVEILVPSLEGIETGNFPTYYDAASDFYERPD